MKNRLQYWIYIYEKKMQYFLNIDQWKNVDLWEKKRMYCVLNIHCDHIEAVH